jgi:hypothetical protein
MRYASRANSNLPKIPEDCRNLVLSIIEQTVLPPESISTYRPICRYIQDVHFAGLLDVQNILVADTGISWQTEDHSFGDNLISGVNQLCHRLL